MAPTGSGGGRTPLLAVEGLVVEFANDRGWDRVINDVSFHVERGETLGIVGESGSGKSVTCLAVNGLIPKPRRAHRRRFGAPRRA